MLADQAKNIVQRLEFFDQYSKPLVKMELTESEKIHFYSKANYRIKVAGRGVDEVVRDIRMTLKL